MRRSFWLIAPYAVWMLMMSVLAPTGANYAWRGAATLAVLIAALGFVPEFRRGLGAEVFKSRAWFAGLGVGVLVAALWLAQAWVPNMFEGVDAASSPYAPSVCGWPLTLSKLLASTLVISVAEELFFRKFLVDFAGFNWMVVLFALNHWRWDLAFPGRLVFLAAGAFAGVAYGLVAQRCGILSAMIAHAVTNFCIGLVVIGLGQWQFW